MQPNSRYCFLKFSRFQLDQNTPIKVEMLAQSRGDSRRRALLDERKRCFQLVQARIYMHFRSAIFPGAPGARPHVPHNEPTLITIKVLDELFASQKMQPLRELLLVKPGWIGLWRLNALSLIAGTAEWGCGSIATAAGVLRGGAAAAIALAAEVAGGPTVVELGGASL